jgi:hypothetical protein
MEFLSQSACGPARAGGVVPATGRRKRTVLLLICAALLLVTGADGASAPTEQQAREYQIKAAALYNIVTFVDWPDTAFPSADAPLVIGVLGEGPVASVVGYFVEGETWHGRKIVVQYYARPADLKPCHVLYVARSEQTSWPTTRQTLRGRPVLTVADADSFATDGGAVQLTIDRNKLHLTVNVATVRAAGLIISSKVLRLAEVVGETKP